MPRFVTAEEIRAACSLDEAITTQKKVFAAHSMGETDLGPRAIITQGANAQFSYIARASKSGPTIVKFGSVFPENSKIGLPAVQTIVAVMSPVDGSLTHYFDGEAVTEIRTVATSMAVALEFSEAPRKIGIVGVGHQGVAHAKAARQLFPKSEIIGIARREKSMPDGIFDLITTNLSDISESNIVFLCTNSLRPIVTEPLGPGVLVISIGSFAPDRAEVAGNVLANADNVYVDDELISREQCGSIVEAYKLQRKWSSLQTIGSIFSGGMNSSKRGATYFFSVGLGIQDAALVEFLLEKVR